MSILLKRFLIIAGLILSFSAASEAQVFVKVRPSAPVIVRPNAPSSRHVWIEGEWVVRGGRYEYVPGYWSVPRPGYHQWVPGRWIARRHGWYWVPGHWRR